MKKLSGRQSISVLVVMCIFTFLGFVSGFYFGTGTLPTFTESEAVLPPQESIIISAKTTKDIVNEAVSPNELGIGYNCVDATLDAWRALAWKGQPSILTVLDCVTGADHMLLYIPTERGWMYLDTTNNAEVYPKVGGSYFDKRIAEIYGIKLLPVPMDEFLEELEAMETADEFLGIQTTNEETTNEQ